MPKNLENHFLEEVRKLKQKKRKRIVRRVGVLLLLLSMVGGFAYLFYQGNPILRIGNLAISIPTLLLSIFGLIIICSLVIYIIKHQEYIRQDKSSVFPV
jgi:magnesium-transporting ATPase (P-type)